MKTEWRLRAAFPSRPITFSSQTVHIRSNDAAAAHISLCSWMVGIVKTKLLRQQRVYYAWRPSSFCLITDYEFRKIRWLTASILSSIQNILPFLVPLHIGGTFTYRYYTPSMYSYFISIFRTNKLILTYSYHIFAGEHAKGVLHLHLVGPNFEIGTDRMMSPFFRCSGVGIRMYTSW